MKELYRTIDGQIFESLDGAIEHDCELFERWGEQPTTPHALIEAASKLGEGAEESLMLALLEVYHGQAA